VLHGEFWIIDSQAVFADGDIDDMNHETVVLDHVRRQYADPRFDYGDWVDWEGFECSLGTPKPHGGGHNTQELRALGMSLDEILIARGDIKGDPREWAVRHLGWKRVRHTSIDTWALLFADMDDISRGLDDAYAELVTEETGFNLNVISVRAIYEDVPYAMISQRNPANLLLYRRVY
jgi:hypothetical protein